MAEEKIKQEEKAEEKQEEKKKNPETLKAKEKTAKDKAIARGASVRISSKHSFAICRMIKKKTPERAIEMLEEVILKKRAVPMKDMEVPHRKGMAGGRYPQTAAGEFIGILKQLKANANVNGIDNPIIIIAKADKASRPLRREGRKSKRTNVYLEAVDRTKLKGNKK